MRISLERAAMMLGTSEQMLRRWVEQGAIPCDETSGECEFDLETLESWAKKRRLPMNRNAVITDILGPNRDTNQLAVTMAAK